MKHEAKLCMLCVAIILLIAGGLYAATIGNVAFLGTQTQRGISYLPIPPSPYLWYDGQSNRNDSTPNAIHLDGSNGVIGFVAGKYQAAMSFERSAQEYAYRVDAITQNYTNEPTWSGWFQLYSLPLTGQEFTLFCIDDSTQQALRCYITTNTFVFNYTDNMGGGDTFSTNIITWTTNAAYFFVVQFTTGAGARIGINTTNLVTKGHTEGLYSLLTPDWYVGVNSSAGTPDTNTTFNGWIDSFCMFTNQPPNLSLLWNNGNGNYYH